MDGEQIRITFLTNDVYIDIIFTFLQDIVFA
jgi:hypothetical protein